MASIPRGNEWKEGSEDDLSILHGCYCSNCGNGKALTTMLPTKIPMFREIIVMNLTCDDCGFRSAQVSFGGEIQPKGKKIRFRISHSDDLNRQVVKSDSAALFIPSLGFEIPAATQKGTVSTLEGIFLKVVSHLETLQPERLRLGDVENFYRCRTVISALSHCVGPPIYEDDDDEGCIFPFEVILDDPSGNSFIENPHAPEEDPHLEITHYQRNPTQDIALGLQPSQQVLKDGYIDDTNPSHQNGVSASPIGRLIIDETVGRSEVLSFPTICPNCTTPSQTDMCVTDIPHFKEVIVMSLSCASCGFKSSEVKGGGVVSKYGNRITLTVSKPDDLAREVLKSDTSGLSIAEIGLTMEEGSLGGVYTTVEGLIRKVQNRLQNHNPFGSGDSSLKHHSTNDGGTFSSLSPQHAKYHGFLKKLDDLADGKLLPFTLVITDPLSSSFVGPIPAKVGALSKHAEQDAIARCGQDFADKGLVVEEFERSQEQNDALGLNDVQTENY